MEREAKDTAAEQVETESPSVQNEDTKQALGMSRMTIKATRIMAGLLKCKWQGTLHDDVSVHEKLKVMSKWEVIADDARNDSPDIENMVEKFLELGKEYEFELTIREL